MEVDEKRIRGVNDMLKSSMESRFFDETLEIITEIRKASDRKKLLAITIE
jgi:hypothetical protein